MVNMPTEGDDTRYTIQGNKVVAQSLALGVTFARHLTSVMCRPYPSPCLFRAAITGNAERLAEAARPPSLASLATPL